jgi:hypothetical protein
VRMAAPVFGSATCMEVKAGCRVDRHSALSARRG